MLFVNIIKMDSDNENMSDEENASIALYIRRTRVIRYRPNHFERWDDCEFYNRFRMSKQTAKLILNQIAPRIENKTKW